MPADWKSWLKPAAYISLASLSCALFTAFTPPSLDAAAAAAFPVAGGPDYGPAAYRIRFALSFALLGLAPAALAAAFGEKPADLGLSLKTPVLRSPLFWLAIPVAAAVGAAGAAFTELGSYYPYYPGLAGIVRERGILPFAGHAAAYLVLYYLPWEFFFRGFLLLPLASAAGRAAPPSPARSAALAACVLFQALPSTMLHAGHPLSEMVGAAPAGIAFGVLAWRTGSIFPGLAIHAALGLGTDAMAVLRAGGWL